MKINNLDELLDALDITIDGHYDNHFYIINLKDSNDYSRMYTKLDRNAINTEYPNFGKNTNNSTVNITNYFEYSLDEIDYNLMLFANFDKGTYYLKISEK